MVTIDATPGVDSRPVINLESPEGGEVRVEHVEYIPGMGSGGRSNSARVFSFFMKNMNPQRFDLPPENSCTDISGDDVWPVAQGTDREYIDIGQLIIAGGPMQLTVPVNPSMMDLFFRTHDLNYFYFGIDDADTYLPQKTAFDVIFTGSDEWPPQVFEDVLYMPSKWTVTSPGMAAITLQADTGFDVTWEVADSMAPIGYDVVALTGFTVTGMGPVALCLGPNSGTMNIPASLVNAVRSLGTGGSLLRQNITHVNRELNNGTDVYGRRIDFISVMCYTTPWTAM